MYVEASTVVPDPEKSSMLWPLEVLPITEHTGLIRKATFLSLFPSQPELHFQIPFISSSLTGRDRIAALKRSLQNWCPAAYCTSPVFIFGGMVLSGSTGDRADVRCQFTWAQESWRLWTSHQVAQACLFMLCSRVVSLLPHHCQPARHTCSGPSWHGYAALLPNSRNRSKPIPPQG